MAENIDAFGRDRCHTSLLIESVRNRPPEKVAVLDQALRATSFQHHEIRGKGAKENLNLLLATHHNAAGLWTWDERGGGSLLEDGSILIYDPYRPDNNHCLARKGHMIVASLRRDWSALYLGRGLHSEVREMNVLGPQLARPVSEPVNPSIEANQLIKVIDSRNHA